MKTNISIFILLSLFSCSVVSPNVDNYSELAQVETVASANTNTVKAKPCTASEYRQFDFWIGDWTVTTPDGNYAGKNSIKPMLNGCALYESWTGNSGYRGDSVNFYDAAKGNWHQTWIDFAGNALYGDGGIVDGSMVLSGHGKNAKGNILINRITWKANFDGSVRQLWETTSDNGQTWATVFDGLYKKAE